MLEDAAQLIVPNLTDVTALAAKSSNAGHRIARRSARGFDARPHRLIECSGTLGIYQGHRAFDQAVLIQKGVI